MLGKKGLTTYLEISNSKTSYAESSLWGKHNIRAARESMNNTGFISIFAPGFGLWECGKPSRVYHIPTCPFLYPKLVRLYAAGTRKNMCRLTGRGLAHTLVAVALFRSDLDHPDFSQIPGYSGLDGHNPFRFQNGLKRNLIGYGLFSQDATQNLVALFSVIPFMFMYFFTPS
jgi:hypothetical protein